MDLFKAVPVGVWVVAALLIFGGLAYLVWWLLVGRTKSLIKKHEDKLQECVSANEQAWADYKRLYEKNREHFEYFGVIHTAIVIDNNAWAIYEGYLYERRAIEALIVTDLNLAGLKLEAFTPEKINAQAEALNALLIGRDSSVAAAQN